MTGTAAVGPAGDAYERLRRGQELLARGDAAAAATVLAHVAEEEPSSTSVLETLARAQYDAGRAAEATATFRRLVDRAPDSDYARFGLGVSLTRVGRFEEAAEQLALAVAMRPDKEEYAARLRQVRATLQARRSASPGVTPPSP